MMYPFKCECVAVKGEIMPLCIWETCVSSWGLHGLKQAGLEFVCLAALRCVWGVLQCLFSGQQQEANGVSLLVSRNYQPPSPKSTPNLLYWHL